MADIAPMQNFGAGPVAPAGQKPRLARRPPMIIGRAMPKPGKPKQPKASAKTMIGQLLAAAGNGGGPGDGTGGMMP